MQSENRASPPNDLVANMEMTPQDFIAAVRAAMAPRETQAVFDGGIRIVILQRGWVVVGRYTRKGQRCHIKNGFVIRRWGTTNGLGQLAMQGPQTNTVLEETPDMDFHQLTEIFTISCREARWSDRLPQ